MKSHYNSLHPSEECTPVDIFNDCGLCNYSFSCIDDLKHHYRRNHKKGEIVTSDLFTSMKLQTLSIDECFFARHVVENLERKALKKL